MKRILILLFFVFSIVFCISVFFENDLLRTITKPLPLVLLLFLIKPNSKYKTLIFIGFIFSLAGDIFLLKVVDQFIFGLVSFLFAHIFYIIAFRSRFKSIKLISSIPFYVLAGILGYYLYPHLGEMLIPVLIYIFIIMTMVWRAFLQRGFNKTAKFGFIGALLFAVSDSNIAFTKFIQNYDYSEIVTILLYWTAQYLIYKSTTKAQ